MESPVGILILFLDLQIAARFMQLFFTVNRTGGRAVAP
jgi:hypothetical protein